MKKNIQILSLLIGGTIALQAQVGINTTTPKASLDVPASNKTSPKITDGVLIPRIDNFPSSNPGTDQQGMLVFLTTDRTFNAVVKAKGFYYWDSSIPDWVGFSSPIPNNTINVYDWAIGGNATTDDTQHFIGTTDAQSLNFKVNNTKSGKIDYASAKGSVSLGYETLVSTDPGKNNTAFGYQALKANIINTSVPNSSSYNTAIGNQALSTNTSGYFNTAVGSGAMMNNSTGARNLANGTYTLYSNTTGIDNTAVGHYSLQSNITGKNNVAIGASAMLAGSPNPTDNIAIGANALFNTSGSKNIGIGTKVLENANNVINNIGIGDQSLSSLSTGQNNLAIGVNALLNYTGNTSFAIGNSALENLRDGTNNMAVGFNSLKLVNDGSYNTAIGRLSMSNLVTGNYNLALGNYIGTQMIGTSNYNILIGSTAIDAQTTQIIGSDNIVISSNLPVGVSNNRIGTSGGHTIVIGNGITNINDNTVRIGDAGHTTYITGNQWSVLSDARIKNNIQENVVGLEFIKNLRPVTYNVNPKKQMEIESPGTKLTIDTSEAERIVQTGFIAQEVEAAAKKVGYDFNGVNIPKNTNQLYSVSYATFVVPLVKAVQEQQEQIEALKQDKTTIDNLKQINLSLENKIQQLENRLQQLESLIVNQKTEAKSLN